MIQSRFGRIIPRDALGLGVDQVPDETELVKMRQFSEVSQHIYPADISEAYNDAIKALTVIFEAARRSPTPPSYSLVNLWIHVVPSRFLELLAERQPGALIVFAHYAVLFKRAEYCWFFQGVSQQVMLIADTLVPHEWKSWLEWPRQQIQALDRISE